MAGYFPLGDIVFPFLFKDGKGQIETKASSLELTLEQRDNVVMVHESIPVQSLEAFFKFLETRPDLTKKHILFGVIGQGATEQHIVAMHLPPNGAQAKVYDSKYSNPERFFAREPSKNTITGIAKGLFHALNPFASPEQTVNLSHFNAQQIKSASYYSFGTQSFFDGVTCGYHTGSLIKTLAGFLEQDPNANPSPKQLLDATTAPVSTSAQKLCMHKAPRVPETSFFSFVKKAWQDTFLPLVAEEERDAHHFGHYFMGWPQANGSKIAYFITLKFITAPITNLLSLAVEFPLNLLSEASSFIKNKLFSWAPTNGVTQSIRSVLLLTTMGLQGLFQGAYYLLRTITSPMASFKAAHKIHPVLGYLSALASACFIGAIVASLTIFAPPILAALMPTMGPGAIAMLNILAYPFAQLFSLLSVSIPAATGAALTFATGALTLAILHMLGRKTIYPEEGTSAADNKKVSPPRTVDIEDEDDSDDLLKGYEVVGESEPYVHGTSGMLNTSFGRRRPVKAKEKSGDGIIPQDIIVHHSI
ncbi:MULTISPECIES: hypothetical protein [Legionella]|uniref:hypothetical protein n=1 Tax=Legionella TaxID=445 RepID=UPI0009639A82|nr:MULTISPECIES: hypothetical protein [Legionella]MBN9227059.1 hypothetical protein [Legionella steelei]OJW07375.1 MAG: hypothetical protein BGO44_17295 [Legionella sp. 39-23]